MDYRIEQLRHQLRENPTSRHFYQLGELLRKEKQAEEAVKILEAGLEHHPRYVSAWVSLGRSHLDIQQLDAAEEAFNKALSFDPENAVAARMIGRVATERGDWLSAVKKLKLARALSPRDETLDQEIADAEAKLAAGEQGAVAPTPEVIPPPEPEPMVEAEMELPPPVPEELPPPPEPEPLAEAGVELPPPAMEELPPPTEPEPMVEAGMDLSPPAYEELPPPTEPEPMVEAEMELPPPEPEELSPPTELEPTVKAGMDLSPPAYEELPLPTEPEPLVEAEMELPPPTGPEPMVEAGMDLSPPAYEELPLPTEPEPMAEAGMELPPPVPEEMPQSELEMVGETVMELPPQEDELIPQPDLQPQAADVDTELAAYQLPEATPEVELLETEEEPEEEYSPWDDAPTVDLPDYRPDRSADVATEAYVGQEDVVVDLAAAPEPDEQQVAAEEELPPPTQDTADESEQPEEEEEEEEDIRATSPIEVPLQLLSPAVERLPESEMVAEDLVADEQVEDLPVPTLTLARLAVEQSDFELAARTLVNILDKEPNNLEAQQLLEMVRISLGETVAADAVGSEQIEELAESVETPSEPSGGSTESIVRALQRWLNSIKLAAERRTT
jgi:Flp pilus assembly protein TadD